MKDCKAVIEVCVLVLIDTWWNVNPITYWKYLVIFGFNRYMVECESTRMTISQIRKAGFNRYMVECELLKNHICHVLTFVLIDTWWNVNEIEKRWFPVADMVLIDTWWNVNE